MKGGDNVINRAYSDWIQRQSNKERQMHYILMQQSVSEAVPVVKNIMGVFRGEDILIQAVNIFHWGVYPRNTC